MKKGIIVALFLCTPLFASAQVDRKAGVEFLSPLVQSIINLLYERISVLQAQVASCNIGSTSGANNRITQIELEIAKIEEDLRLKTEELKRIYRHLWPDYIGDYQTNALEKIGALKFEKQRLEIELRGL